MVDKKGELMDSNLILSLVSNILPVILLFIFIFFFARKQSTKAIQRQDEVLNVLKEIRDLLKNK